MPTISYRGGLSAAVLVTTSLAAAQTTWIVDDDGGPGVDFTSIQDALAVAGPFDLVDVFPGDYAAFTMSAPARVLGRAGAEVAGTSRIEAIGAGEWALVGDLAIDRLELADSAGTIVVADVRCFGQGECFLVSGCADVRAQGLFVSGPFAFGSTLARVDGSRAQFDDSTFLGRDGGIGASGQIALWGDGTSRIHLSRCTLEGGRGGDGQDIIVPTPAGDGAPALWLTGGAEARIVRSTLRGGAGGVDPSPPPFFDGAPASGLYACGGHHEAWASTFEGGSTFGVVAPPTTLACGATLETASPLPSFEVVGTPTPGAPIALELTAQPGASARLLVGRRPALVPLPGTTLPRLVDVGRLASLGALPGNGIASLASTVPPWPRGAAFFVQASRTTAAGETEMTNAQVVLVR